MVDCAYGYQEKIEKEACEGERKPVQEEGCQEEACQEKNSSPEKSGEEEGRSEKRHGEKEGLEEEAGRCEAEIVTKKKVRGKSQSSSRVSFAGEEMRPRSGGQSGDLQGLSRREDADSESVTELIEEGNAFEADVVKGVEDAGNADESEVHTHEVPEDDVPGEYLDKD